MRILVVTQYFWPEAFRINDLVSELIARGHDVTVFTGKPNYPDGRLFESYKASPANFADYHGAPVIRVPIITRGRSTWRLMMNYLSFAAVGTLLAPWRLRNVEFDCIFICQVSPVTVALPAIMIRWLRRKPTAMWIQDLWPDTLIALGIVRSRFLLGLANKAVAAIYRGCDLILVQSRTFVPGVLALLSRPTPITYFPNWAEPIFGPAATEAAAEIAPANNVFSIMFAGNVGDAQDFPAILAAAEALRANTKIRWLIVGDGRMLPWLREQVLARGLKDTVILLGRHPTERMPSFYLHADALLVSLKPGPAFALTIPAKVQSYLASGKPILAMMDGEGADIIRRSGAGIACPAGDSQALANAVTTLAAMTDDQRQEMGNNGRAFSAAEFNREQLISQLEGWLAKLAAGQPVASGKG